MKNQLKSNTLEKLATLFFKLCLFSKIFIQFENEVTNILDTEGTKKTQSSQRKKLLSALCVSFLGAVS